MKWFLGILGIAAAGFVGYVVEPSMRASLTGTGSAPPEALAQAPDPVTPSSADGFAPAPPPPMPVPAPEPVVTEVDPEPLAEADPMETPPLLDPSDTEPEATEPEMVDVPGLTPEPSPEPDAAEPAGASADVVAVMQASIKGGEIKEFTFQQVQGWKAGEDEVVDGETFQTGLVAYTAETVFGVRTIEAKAFIKGGKVERWIWPKSGLEIK